MACQSLPRPSSVPSHTQRPRTTEKVKRHCRCGQPGASTAAGLRGESGAGRPPAPPLVGARHPTSRQLLPPLQLSALTHSAPQNHREGEAPLSLRAARHQHRCGPEGRVRCRTPARTTPRRRAAPHFPPAAPSAPTQCPHTLSASVVPGPRAPGKPKTNILIDEPTILPIGDRVVPDRERREGQRAAVDFIFRPFPRLFRGLLVALPQPVLLPGPPAASASSNDQTRDPAISRLAF